MWLTRVSILRPVTIMMVVFAIVVLGLLSLQKLPVDLYPKIDFPFVTVTAVYSGTGPQEIETLITKPLEDAVSTISGVKNVTSTSARRGSPPSRSSSISAPNLTPPTMTCGRRSTRCEWTCRAIWIHQ